MSLWAWRLNWATLGWETKNKRNLDVDNLVELSFGVFITREIVKFFLFYFFRYGSMVIRIWFHLASGIFCYHVWFAFLILIWANHTILCCTNLNCMTEWALWQLTIEFFLGMTCFMCNNGGIGSSLNWAYLDSIELFKQWKVGQPNDSPETKRRHFTPIRGDTLLYNIETIHVLRIGHEKIIEKTPLLLILHN